MEISKSPTAVICLSPNKGGMELASLKLAKILSKYIEITLIIQKDQFMHQQCLHNKDYSNLNFETIAFKSTLSPSIVLHARTIVRKNNINNVIFVGASELKSLYFAFLGLDINLIVRHGTTKSTPKKDFFHKLIYSNVNYHVAISKHISQNVLNIIPFGKNTILKTIYPSMAKECSSIVKTKSDTIRLLHVGRVTPGKGLEEALLACNSLYEKHIKFHIDSYGAMTDTYATKLNNFINTLPYKDSISLCGFTNNIYDEYQKHDIFIFPTKGEGFGNVMMEAIAHGIIILAFDNTAITNFKEMGFSIHLVKDADLAALTNELFQIIRDIDNERNKADLNIALAKKIFAPQREAEQYLDILQ